MANLKNLGTCLNAERNRIDRMPDAAQAARDAAAAIDVVQDALNRFAQLRSELLRELRYEHGWSLGEIASEFGITRARVAQLTS
ncbi:MAG: sigma factor-like helix-turn-helix DNA-binding protein [Acidimicrobiia bacterium]